MSAILPIILFDTKKNQLQKDNIIDSQTFYIYSYQNFGIKIIGIEYLDVSSDTIITINQDFPEWDSILADISETIFSAKLNPANNKVVIDSQKAYNPVNFGYTIFISQNLTKVWYELTDINGNTEIYTFKQVLSNIITDSNAHYLDLIINKYLPTPEELLPALFLGDTGAENFSNREILKRLLLDFREILKHKGTKKSIELFFNFVGINNLNVFEEWLKNGKYIDDNLDGVIDEFETNRSVTLKPNTETDVKTGNYYVEYYNWEKTDELDSDNLPIRKLSVEDLDKFFDTLKHAIALANTYFTLLEQEIIFFGLVYSSNAPINQNITSIHNNIFRINPFDFRKHLLLDTWQNSQGHITGDTNQYKKYLLNNLVQQNDMFYRSEIKFIRNAGLWDKNTFWIDAEISDLKEDNPDDLDKIFSVFGTCFNMLLVNKFDQELTFKLDNIGINNNNISDTKVIKVPAGTETNAFYVHKEPGIYSLQIRITDMYNNSELYTYEYEITDDYSKLDFSVYTSKAMIDLNNTGIPLVTDSSRNDITSEVDSPSLITTPIDINYLNYILGMIDTPSNILEYYHKESSVNPVRWLTDNQQQYIIPNISIYDIIDDISETIPLELTEQWVEICAYQYSDNYQLMLRWFDARDCQYKLIDYSDIQKMNDGIDTYGTLNGIDKLFITILDITEQETMQTVPYMFIMSTETGLDLDTWDFVIVPKSIVTKLPSEYESDKWKDFDCFQEKILTFKNAKQLLDNDLQITRIPVNHDYPLFTKTSLLVPGFKHYISNDVPKIEIPSADGVINTYPLMKSMFMRLVNLMDDTNNGIDLKLADIVLAKINRDFITEEVNITWSIVNTFTGEVYHSTSDLALKYRLTENTIYTIRLDININGKLFQLYRPSIVSSFKRTTLLEN